MSLGQLGRGVVPGSALQSLGGGGGGYAGPPGAGGGGGGGGAGPEGVGGGGGGGGWRLMPFPGTCGQLGLRKSS